MSYRIPSHFIAKLTQCTGSHQTDQVEQGLDKTLSDLGLEYLDLYLMHWPVASSRGGNYIDYVDVGSNTLHPHRDDNLDADLARHGKAPRHRQSSSHRSL